MSCYMLFNLQKHLFVMFQSKPFIKGDSFPPFLPPVEGLIPMGICSASCETVRGNLCFSVKHPLNQKILITWSDVITKVFNR